MILALSIAIAVLSLAAGWSYRRYRATRDDRLRLLALLLWYLETQARMERARQTTQSASQGRA